MINKRRGRTISYTVSILAVLSLSIFVLSQPAAATVATDNWRTYTNPTYGFEIKYPPNWDNPDDQMYSDGVYYTHVVRFNPLFPITEPFVNVGFFDLSINNTEVTLAQFVETQIQSLKEPIMIGGEQFNEVTILESNATTTLNNYTAHKVVWEDRTLMADDPSTAISKKMSIWIIDGDKAWDLTYVGQDRQAFAQYLPVAEAIINSFRVLNNNSPPISGSVASSLP